MDRDELHELVMMLKEELAAGRLQINSALSIQSLENVRYSNDGKVDPATVDSAVRALTCGAGGSLQNRGQADSP